jgi:hypothetical protein
MIVLECNNDEFFIKKLGFIGRLISHQRCKGEVVKKVGKISRAIGIIDEDDRTTEPKEIKKYMEHQAKGSITLFQRRNDKAKRLVQISPYLEHWLLKRARANKINPKDFNLPDNPKRLHDYPNLRRVKNFDKFIKKLIDTDTEIQTLKKWIEEALG